MIKAYKHETHTAYEIIDYGFAKQHNPKSEELFEFISTLDFKNGDYFCFKSGGDGDIGEFLMDLFDCYFKNKAGEQNG